MDEEIDQVVAEDIDLVDVVIEGEGKIAHKPAAVEFPYRSQIGDIVDIGIVDNIREIVEVKRTVKTIRVDNNPDQTDENERYKRDEKNGVPVFHRFTRLFSYVFSPPNFLSHSFLIPFLL